MFGNHCSRNVIKNIFGWFLTIKNYERSQGHQVPVTFSPLGPPLLNTKLLVLTFLLLGMKQKRTWLHWAYGPTSLLGYILSQNLKKRRRNSLEEVAISKLFYFISYIFQTAKAIFQKINLNSYLFYVKIGMEETQLSKLRTFRLN